MKNKTLLFGTVLAATGVGVLAGNSEAKADSLYTVQAGDTLYKISRQFTGGNGFVDEIIQANNFQNPNLIYVGEQITIPTPGEQTTAPVQQTAAQAPAQEAPAQEVEQPVQQTEVQAPAQEVEQPVQQTTAQAPAQEVEQPVQQTQETTQASSTSGDSSEDAAKNWIANKESGGSYTARNGRYIGKYQLDSSYLNGDYSAANQERVADNYVKSRYGSWANAKAFWESNGWY